MSRCLCSVSLICVSIVVITKHAFSRCPLISKANPWPMSKTQNSTPDKVGDLDTSANSVWRRRQLWTPEFKMSGLLNSIVLATVVQGAGLRAALAWVRSRSDEHASRVEKWIYQLPSKCVHGIVNLTPLGMSKDSVTLWERGLYANLSAHYMREYHWYVNIIGLPRSSL